MELLSNVRFALLQALIRFSGEQPLPLRVVNRVAVRADRQNGEDLIGFASVLSRLIFYSSVHCQGWRSR